MIWVADRCVSIGGELACSFWRDRRAAVATEYAMLVALIAIVAAVGMVLLGANLQEFFSAIGSAVEGAGEPVPPLPEGT